MELIITIRYMHTHTHTHTHKNLHKKMFHFVMIVITNYRII